MGSKRQTVVPFDAPIRPRFPKEARPVTLGVQWLSHAEKINPRRAVPLQGFDLLADFRVIGAMKPPLVHHFA